MTITLASALSTFVGEELSSVEFVRDYLQLRFYGATMTVITKPYIVKPDRTIYWDDYGFKDELCINISNILQSAEVTDDYVCIKFNNLNALYISLRPEDYEGPEALELVTDNGIRIVA